MKDLINELQIAINYFKCGCVEDDICINMSEFVFNNIFAIAIERKYNYYSYNFKYTNSKNSKFMGIDINTMHPYNEIVIYNKKQTFSENIIVLKFNAISISNISEISI